MYWGWWLSWSPFVGMFIARVSRGRTIREFVTGVLFVPAGFTLMWMTVFGNSAIYLIMNQGATDLANTVQQDVALALFNFPSISRSPPYCHSLQWRWSSSSSSRLLTRGQWLWIRWHQVGWQTPLSGSVSSGRRSWAL